MGAGGEGFGGEGRLMGNLQARVAAAEGVGFAWCATASARFLDWSAKRTVPPRHFLEPGSTSNTSSG